MGHDAVQGIAFDLYGTLIDVNGVQEACGAITQDPAAFTNLWRQKQLEYTFLRSLMGRYEDFWQVTEAALRYALKRLNIQATEGDRRRLMEAWLHLPPFPDVKATLPKLQGYALAVLSNGSPRMLEEVLANSGLKPSFRWVFSADAAKTYKPSPKVYALGPEGMGLSKEAILFVSSNGFDVAGAKAFGFPVCWLNRAGAFLDELGLEPDMVVRSFEELPQALER